MKKGITKTIPLGNDREIIIDNLPCNLTKKEAEKIIRIMEVFFLQKK